MVILARVLVLLARVLVLLARVLVLPWNGPWLSLRLSLPRSLKVSLIGLF
jgi:hypothetical protein